MINRLVAENTFKLPNRAQPTFAISKKLIAFQTDTSIKVKTLHRDTKDIDIPIAQPPLQFQLSQVHPWVMVLTPAFLLQVYLVEYINGISEGSFKKVAILHNVSEFRQNRWGLILSFYPNQTLKILSFKEIIEKTEINLNIDCNSLKSLTDLAKIQKIITSADSDRVLVVKQGAEGMKEIVTEIYDRVNKGPKHERYAVVTYLREVLAFYKGRFVFQRKGEKQIEIIDIDESKLMGKFALQGAIKHCQIRQNLLLMITTKQNIDMFTFLVLNNQPTSTQPLITNRVTYEKGKGDMYRLFNLLSSEAAQFLDKKKNTELPEEEIKVIEEQNTSSLLYILNKTKEKIEIIKLDHSKLLKSPFGEEKMDSVIYSKKSADFELMRKKEEAAEVERSRIHSSIELKAGQKSMQEMQKRFVQSLIDIKLKKVMVKFDQLQQRVANLQNMIKGINSKIELNLQKINRKEIKQKVQQLFENLTPQFEKYFSEIFKQVSGVFEQGVTYYNLKLAKEAEFHKEALTQIVSETFKFTEEVAEISKKEQSISEKTEEHLRKILETKKKWNKASEELENRTREVGAPVVNLSAMSGLGGGPGTSSSAVGESPKPEGKVFVRADLNYPASKRDP